MRLWTPPLPRGIVAILGALVQDQGRIRAATLLAILGADPDYVERHIKAIHHKLGVQSPGMFILQTLVDKTREASSPLADLVPDQHIVSQCLADQWTELVDPKAGKQLIRYNLAYNDLHLTGAAGVRHIKNFIKIDSAAVEKVWKTVEDRLPIAIEAARSQELFDSSELVDLVKNAIALHFVRNPTIREIHEEAFEQAHLNSIEALANSPLSRMAFEEEFGLISHGSEAQRIGAERMLNRMEMKYGEGVLFRLRQQDLFEQISDRFAGSGLEIYTPEDSHREFLLGDVPALPVDPATGLAGLSEGIGLAFAKHVVLPLGPRMLAALGPSNGYRAISDAEVEQLNSQQVRLADQYVYYRPGAGFDTKIPAWRTASPIQT